MVDENWIALAEDTEDLDEEVTLEFDASHAPDAVWEWNGESWVAVAA
jgi:hypothetical protein